MDAEVLAALARWPNVPDVYGWLRLDPRGQWHLGDGLVHHAGLAAFLGRNYVVPVAGACYVQNGPQRVFVSLDYTPWVLRCDRDGRLTRHTGEAIGDPGAAWIDEAGSVLIAFGTSIGIVDDRDLAFLAQGFRGENLAVSAECALEAFLAAPGSTPLWLDVGGAHLPVGPILRSGVPKLFCYDPAPKPSAIPQPRP